MDSVQQIYATKHGFFYITLFILMKVIHREEGTTTPVQGTNFRSTE